MTDALVRDHLPEVYADLEAMIDAEGAPTLREQLATLRVVEPCGCGDSFCASFYTGPRPRRSWSDEGAHETMAHGATSVVFSVDLVDGVIRYVEIISSETTAGQRVVEALERIAESRR